MSQIHFFGCLVNGERKGSIRLKTTWVRYLTRIFEPPKSWKITPSTVLSTQCRDTKGSPQRVPLWKFGCPLKPLDPKEANGLWAPAGRGHSQAFDMNKITHILNNQLMMKFWNDPVKACLTCCCLNYNFRGLLHLNSSYFILIPYVRWLNHHSARWRHVFHMFSS